MHKLDVSAVLRRHGGGMATPAGSARLHRDVSEPPGEDALEWSWPPYAPVESDDEPFHTTDWAPSSVVWRPAVRVGRWTVVYRRC